MGIRKIINRWWTAIWFRRVSEDGLHCPITRSSIFESALLGWCVRLKRQRHGWHYYFGVTVGPVTYRRWNIGPIDARPGFRRAGDRPTRLSMESAVMVTPIVFLTPERPGSYVSEIREWPAGFEPTETERAEMEASIGECIITSVPQAPVREED